MEFRTRIRILSSLNSLAGLGERNLTQCLMNLGKRWSWMIGR